MYINLFIHEDLAKQTKLSFVVLIFPPTVSQIKSGWLYHLHLQRVCACVGTHDRPCCVSLWQHLLHATLRLRPAED